MAEAAIDSAIFKSYTPQKRRKKKEKKLKSLFSIFGAVLYCTAPRDVFFGFCFSICDVNARTGPRPVARARCH